MKNSPLVFFNYSIKNQTGKSEVDIYIDGDIVDASTQQILSDWYGDDTSVSYKSFRDKLNEIEFSTLNVYVNSGGGQITEAMAIHDYLVDLQNKGTVVNTEGRGIVASAATYILMAAKKPKMSANSWLMIHNVSGMIWGNVNEIENYAATMRKFNDAANEFYQQSTGLSKTVITNMMDAETWMTAKEASEKGFISSVSNEAKFSNQIKPEQWPFQNRAVLNSYNSFTQKKDPDMENNKIAEAIQNGFNSLLNKLGLSAKEDDAETKEALKQFSQSIVDAIDSIEPGKAAPDEEAIKTIVNASVKESIENAFKEAPENLVTSISETLAKDFVNKTEAEKFAQKEDALNKVDFEAEMKTLKKDIVDKISGSGSNSKDKKPNPSNKWAYENLWPTS